MNQPLAEKLCGKCRSIKSVAGFYRRAGRKDGLQSFCIECCKAVRAERYGEKKSEVVAGERRYREQNREKVAARRAAYYQSNKQDLLVGNRLRSMAWRKANPERRRAASRNEARRNTVAYKLNQRIGVSLRTYLRGRKGGSRTEAIVGYTLLELHAHIERQFLRGMSWDNMGEWHIDHIVPLCAFEFDGPDDPEVKRAWGLANLRPIWARDNIAKNGKRTHLI